MKKSILILALIVSFSGWAVAERKRKVVKAPSKTSTATKTTAKLDDVSRPKKRTMSKALLAWLEGLKKQINKTYSPVKSNQMVAVAAVRGSESVETPPLYWKGKKPENLVVLPEIKDFDAAIETTLTGDPEAAKEKLQSFMLAYPKSSLVADAKETLVRLEENSSNP